MKVEKLQIEIGKLLIGKTIKNVFYMTSKEAEEQFGWFSRPLIIEFTDGSQITAMSDDEGNDGGAYSTSFKKYRTIGTVKLNDE